MGQSLLEIRNLNKSYGEHAILKDFNLNVAKGDVVVIIGPSGCGKSTLLRCMITPEQSVIKIWAQTAGAHLSWC